MLQIQQAMQYLMLVHNKRGAVLKASVAIYREATFGRGLEWDREWLWFQDLSQDGVHRLPIAS